MIMPLWAHPLRHKILGHTRLSNGNGAVIQGKRSSSLSLGILDSVIVSKVLTNLGLSSTLRNLLLEGGALHSISWIVGSISVSSLEFDQVINILKVSLFLGILHLLAAMILRVRRNLKEGDKIAAYLESIP